ncbi:MAG: hypothetical protein EOO24_08795 [Comamonadaceae bacterium]|nr:MAG: hypothetical protein EOO24_08795 [Comamonadaceae bacterium]
MRANPRRSPPRRCRLPRRRPRSGRWCRPARAPGSRPRTRRATPARRPSSPRSCEGTPPC